MKGSEGDGYEVRVLLAPQKHYESDSKVTQK